MKPLHEELKELRQEQNLTLKDIAGKTRIRRDFLERLEDGDYKVAPMPFVRAFFREYAEVLGVDATLAMAKLDKKIDTILAPKPADEPAPEPASAAEEVSEPVAVEPATEPAPDEQASEPEPVTSDAEDNLKESAVSDETAVTEEDAPDAQASLFDNAADDSDDVRPVADETPEAVGDGDDSEKPVKNRKRAAKRKKTGVKAETAEAVPDDSVITDASAAPETEELSTVSEQEALPVPAVVQDTQAGAIERVEIELDENVKPSEHVRRPLVIEEEHSLSNIVFAVIVVGILIVAGVLVFLHRGTLF